MTVRRKELLASIGCITSVHFAGLTIPGFCDSILLIQDGKRVKAINLVNRMLLYGSTNFDTFSPLEYMSRYRRKISEIMMFE